ncbi:MAG TPA: HEAT repeat domain-containing protein, partial [Gemmatimonadales bacterium]|nr:HEAT repeat domain-containing protein [Gemmatimonadales bacterium]
ANLASAPTMVVFDAGNHVLKTLHFDQPTAWLATELKADDNLWDRQWAIRQLGMRPADSAAEAALADAAVHADYYLTRVDAVRALGGFGTAAVPAVAAALADTSASVRAAALAALGRLGGAQAAALARGAWSNDSSYEVRAAAVTALVQLDTAGARDVLAVALVAPSYQDAIRNAALQAIAVRNDTSFTAAVDGLVGPSRDAVYVLAALGARGSAHALDLLAARLDDARRTVRGWALQAFQYALPKAVALARLRAAVDGLTHADAKAAVQDAIRELERRPE